MITFLIDPQHAREAVLTGDHLRVTITGDRNQYRKVTVERGDPARLQAIAIAKRAGQ